VPGSLSPAVERLGMVCTWYTPGYVPGTFQSHSAFLSIHVCLHAAGPPPPPPLPPATLARRAPASAPSPSHAAHCLGSDSDPGASAGCAHAQQCFVLRGYSVALPVLTTGVACPADLLRLGLLSSPLPAFHQHPHIATAGLVEQPARTREKARAGASAVIPLPCAAA
jgi:hypothetical protein